jgi:hypothetical protein
MGELFKFKLLQFQFGVGELHAKGLRVLRGWTGTSVGVALRSPWESSPSSRSSRVDAADTRVRHCGLASGCCVFQVIRGLRSFLPGWAATGLCETLVVTGSLAPNGVLHATPLTPIHIGVIDPIRSCSAIWM